LLSSICCLLPNRVTETRYFLRASHGGTSAFDKHASARRLRCRHLSLSPTPHFTCHIFALTHKNTLSSSTPRLPPKPSAFAHNLRPNKHLQSPSGRITRAPSYSPSPNTTTQCRAQQDKIGKSTRRNLRMMSQKRRRSHL
jgi:hypothetical protein